MRVFLTGASGFIGSAIVPELLDAGHEVLGLARSETSAAAITATGAEVQRGALDDLDSLRAGAGAADGVIHTAYIHDFSDMPAAARADLAAIGALGDALAGTGKPLIVTSGTAVTGPGHLGLETDEGDAAANPRAASEDATLALAERDVRSAVLRLPPSVHGEGDHGFVAFLTQIAREKGLAGFIGDGANRWPAVHRLDAARLFRLALERAPAGSVLHGSAEEGVPTRDIAEAIGRQLSLPAGSVAPEAAAEHFGWIAHFFGWDVPASSALTRALLEWEPTHPGLLADLDAGHYA